MLLLPTPSKHHIHIHFFSSPPQHPILVQFEVLIVSRRGKNRGDESRLTPVEAQYERPQACRGPAVCLSLSLLLAMFITLSLPSPHFRCSSSYVLFYGLAEGCLKMKSLGLYSLANREHSIYFYSTKTRAFSVFLYPVVYGSVLYGVS